jgi:hypothetical protein
MRPLWPIWLAATELKECKRQDRLGNATATLFNSLSDVAKKEVTAKMQSWVVETAFNVFCCFCAVGYYYYVVC